jgi:hypothetical protein
MIMWLLIGAAVIALLVASVCFLLGRYGGYAKWWGYVVEPLAALLAFVGGTAVAVAVYIMTTGDFICMMIGIVYITVVIFAGMLVEEYGYKIFLRKRLNR